MSADVINLRRARKAIARDAAKVQAAANAARHGSTRAERAGAAAEADRLRRAVDGARIDPGEGDA